MKKPDGKRFCPLSKNPLVIGGRNLRCFQGFGYAITVCLKTIVYVPRDRNAMSAAARTHRCDPVE